MLDPFAALLLWVIAINCVATILSGILAFSLSKETFGSLDPEAPRH